MRQGMFHFVDASFDEDGSKLSVQRERVVRENPASPGFRESFADRCLPALDKSDHAVPGPDGHRFRDIPKHRTVNGPFVRLITAENQGEDPLGSMLSDGESEAGSPRETYVMGSSDPQCVQDCCRIGNPCAQRVGGDLVRLVAAPLPPGVGEDEAEFVIEPLKESGGLRVLKWIREAGIDKNRWATASRIFEEGPDVVYGIRREGHGSRSCSVGFAA
jgi:hypothetical protein